jgi:hypothetical protein
MPARATSTAQHPDVRLRIEHRPRPASSRTSNLHRGRHRCSVSNPTSGLAANALKDRADRCHTTQAAITLICAKPDAVWAELVAGREGVWSIFGRRAVRAIPQWHRSNHRHRAVEVLHTCRPSSRSPRRRAHVRRMSTCHCSVATAATNAVIDGRFWAGAKSRSGRQKPARELIDFEELAI